VVPLSHASSLSSTAIVKDSHIEKQTVNRRSGWQARKVRTD